MTHLNEGRRNIDYILRETTEKKQTLLSQLRDENLPSKIREYIPVNGECLRQMGKGNAKSSYSCTKCLEVGRLVPYRSGTPSEFYIESGARRGTKISILEENSPHSKVKWDPQARTISQQISQINNLNSCGVSGSPVAERYLSSDNWLNGVLINWCIESIFKQRRTPHTLEIIEAFVCNDVGYVLKADGSASERSSVDLTSMEWDEARVASLFRQIGAILLTLKPYQFVHGTATLDKLSASLDEPCGYAFNDSKIIGDFTLKIGGFHLSSITLSGTRLFPSTYARNVDLLNAVTQFTPCVQSFEIPEVDLVQASCSSGNCSLRRNGYVFRMGHSGPTLFTTMRYSGYPLFGGAFDTYSFLTSLLSWKPIGEVVSKSERLTAVWTNLFPESHKAPEIESSDTPVTCSYEISKHLHGSWMYCDAPEMLLELCDKYLPN